MQKGNINVNTENIFPIIKKFLYSDQEIFLRELISNAVDATQKLKSLSSLGEVEGDINADDLKIMIKADEKAGTITISDMGIGMTAEDIDKYINQIAFSGAEEFVNKFKDKDVANMIGHFGLGFYSSFMVADKVEIQSLSYKDGSKSAMWECEGSTEFKIKVGKRKTRGTDIILYISEESKEYLSNHKLLELLNKYCKYLPVPIEFQDNIINNTEPIWAKKPSELSDDDYKEFYSQLYPGSEPPLFWIHLNVDYPFNLTGVLYFPKLGSAIEHEKNKVKLFSNQVYVTDSVKDVLPEFLTLLQGVIDSPDIPLNVSRSSLQSDSNVKKITSHISKKVGDKLSENFKNDRGDFEEKWENMDIFVKYGMLSDDKFYDKAKDYCLVQNVDEKFFTIPEYQEKVKSLQSDKDNKIVFLYSNSSEGQVTYIDGAVAKGYDVLKLSGVLDNHFVNLLEQKNTDLSAKRVDADHVDKLIDKGEDRVTTLSEEQVSELKELSSKTINDETIQIQMENLSSDDDFMTVTESEFERRMKESMAMNGLSADAFPDRLNLIINTNHPDSEKILNEGNEDERSEVLKQHFDLALLAKGKLSGKKLADFINRSRKFIS
jgi:molecular chaperone HtpG